MAQQSCGGACRRSADTAVCCCTNISPHPVRQQQTKPTHLLVNELLSEQVPEREAGHRGERLGEQRLRRQQAHVCRPNDTKALGLLLSIALGRRRCAERRHLAVPAAPIYTPAV